MRHNIKLVFFIAIAVSMLSSCVSSKQMVFLNDAAPSKTFKKLPLSETEHILKTGDILYVSIKTMNADLNQLLNPQSGSNNSGQQFANPSNAYLFGYEVDSAGYINLPVLGKVKVGGIPLPKVQEVVQKRAAKYIKNAIVNVKMLNFKVTVMGEVNSQGVYYNPDNTMTVLQAIAMAGGSSNTSAIKNVLVIRSMGKRDKTYRLDLRSKNCYLSPGFYLQPNDYVIVHPNAFKNFQLNAPTISFFLSTTSAILALIFVLFKK